MNCPSDDFHLSMWLLAQWWDVAWRKLMGMGVWWSTVRQSGELRQDFQWEEWMRELFWLGCLIPVSPPNYGYSMEGQMEQRERRQPPSALLSLLMSGLKNQGIKMCALLVLITRREMSSVRGRGRFYWGWKLLELGSEDHTQAQPSNDQISNWSS